MAPQRGLTAAQVSASRDLHGANRLPEPGRPSPARLMLGQLAHAFAIMLWVAAGMAMVAFVATFIVLGWRSGEPFPTGNALLSASGAAFVTVVLLAVDAADKARRRSRARRTRDTVSA